ncbi:MAG: hypothetical protein IJ231_02415 [Clostridia bacterium]|nr:hypothetical protein [Clostridia bacterium]
MITGELKNRIDSIWEIFWTGGLTNPLDVIEQMPKAGIQHGIRYEPLSVRFQETKDKYDAVTAEIAQRGIRRREFGRFIHSLESLPEMVTEFSEELWGSLVDHVTVHSKDNIVFTLTSGMEIKA